MADEILVAQSTVTQSLDKMTIAGKEKSRINTQERSTVKF